MGDVVQPGVGQSLSLLLKSILRAPLRVRTVPPTVVHVARTLGAPSTSRKTRIMAGMEHDTRSKPAICTKWPPRCTTVWAREANSIASALRPPSHAAAAARLRSRASFSSVRLRSFEEMKRNDYSLCARLERTSVSTWSMLQWAAVVTSDLG